MEQLISVIVPVYNVQDYLKRCVDTIINQEYSNLEIILVDDGSTDESGIICDSLETIDHRIKVLHQDNCGISEARNAGLRISKGDYVAFVDSDDYLHPQYISIMKSALDKTNADLAMCRHQETTLSTREKFNRLEEESFNTKIFDCHKVLNENKILNFVYPWNKLYRKSVFENLEFPKGKLHEDVGIIYRLFFYAKSLVLVDVPLYYYYLRQNSITISAYSLRHLDIVDQAMNDYTFFMDKGEPAIAELVIYNAASLLIAQYGAYSLAHTITSEQKRILIKTYRKMMKKIVFFEYITLKNKILKSFYAIVPIAYLVLCWTRERGGKK